MSRKVLIICLQTTFLLLFYPDISISFYPDIIISFLQSMHLMSTLVTLSDVENETQLGFCSQGLDGDRLKLYSISHSVKSWVNF